MNSLTADLHFHFAEPPALVVGKVHRWVEQYLMTYLIRFNYSWADSGFSEGSQAIEFENYIYAQRFIGEFVQKRPEVFIQNAELDFLSFVYEAIEENGEEAILLGCPIRDMGIEETGLKLRITGEEFYPHFDNLEQINKRYSDVTNIFRSAVEVLNPQYGAIDSFTDLPEIETYISENLPVSGRLEIPSNIFLHHDFCNRRRSLLQSPYISQLHSEEWKTGRFLSLGDLATDANSIDYQTAKAEAWMEKFDHQLLHALIEDFKERQAGRDRVDGPGGGGPG